MTKVVRSACATSSKVRRSVPQVNVSRCGASTTSTVPAAAGWPSNAEKWIAPPGRRSISTGLGNQRPRCSGVVTARHTLSIGCGYSRSTRTVGRPSRVRNRSAAIARSFVVIAHRVEVRTEVVEARLPHPAVRRQPVVDLRQRLDPQAVPAARPVHPDGDQPRVAQDAQVLRRERLGQAERVGEVAHEAFTTTQLVEQRPPDRLRQHLERGSHPCSMPLDAYATQGIFAVDVRTAVAQHAERFEYLESFDGRTRWRLT